MLLCRNLLTDRHDTTKEHKDKDNWDNTDRRIHIYCVYIGLPTTQKRVIIKLTRTIIKVMNYKVIMNMHLSSTVVTVYSVLTQAPVGLKPRTFAILVSYQLDHQDKVCS